MRDSADDASERDPRPRVLPGPRKYGQSVSACVEPDQPRWCRVLRLRWRPQVTPAPPAELRAVPGMPGREGRLGDHASKESVRGGRFGQGWWPGGVTGRGCGEGAAAGARRLSAAACWSVLLGLFIAVAPPPPAAVAVVGGQPDGDAHPYVGMILGPGSAVPSCSGVLVGAVFLTAAHCLFHGGRRTGTGVRVAFGSSLATATTVGGVFYVDPLYDPSVSQAHDLAAVVLDADPGVPPALLGPVGVTSGYHGLLMTVGAGAPHVGTRWVATERVVSRHAGWLGLVPGDGNSCNGDSGGPDLMPGTDVVVALTDRGSCSEDEDQRVDTLAAQTLVSAAVQWPHHPPFVKVALGRSRPRPGHIVSLAVRLSPLYAGEVVDRQQRFAGRWVTRQTAVVDVHGSAGFRFAAGAAGRSAYRVRLGSTGTHPASTSRVVTLLVR